MAQGAGLVAALKRSLKAQGLTYARVAHGLGMSEASVKRMFSRREFTLKRLEQICEFAGVELAELARSLGSDERLLAQLSRQQEREIVADRKLMLVALCAMGGWTLEQMLAAYSLTEVECIRLLLRLDRLKVIRLHPGNRIRLLLSRSFSWLPDGPMQQYFKVQAQNDYFRSRFSRPDELMLFVTGRLSAASRSAMIARLRRVASEFNDLHNEDSRLPFQERAGVSMLIAIRPWELSAFHDLRRKAGS
jgi:transcriptional regulator with XRE-family HTH domain